MGDRGDVDAEEGPSGRKARFFFVAFGVLLVGAVAASMFVDTDDRDDPEKAVHYLVEGPSTEAPSEVPVDPENVSLPGREPYVIPYRHGEEWVWKLSVVNQTDKPVEVVGFPLEGTLFDPVEVTILAAKGPEGRTPEAFEPFTMEPGEEWLVFHKIRFGKCTRSSGAEFHAGFNVDVADGTFEDPEEDPYLVSVHYPIDIQTQGPGVVLGPGC